MTAKTRSRLFHGLELVVAAAVVVFVLFAGYTIVDNRNEARARTAAAVARTNAKATLNEARIGALAAITAQNCATLNTDARRLNAVLDYFEAYVKAQDPGPATNRFFAALPRPVETTCTAIPSRSPPP